MGYYGNWLWHACGVWRLARCGLPSMVRTMDAGLLEPGTIYQYRARAYERSCQGSGPAMSRHLYTLGWRLVERGERCNAHP